MSEAITLVLAVLACWVVFSVGYAVVVFVHMGIQVRRDLARMERDKLRERGLA